MPAIEVLNRKELIKTVKKYQGKIAVVAQKMGVSTNTVYNYANRYKSVKNAIEKAQSNWDCKLVDTAETKLFAAVLEGSSWAVKYTLETKGRKRGYVTQDEDAAKTDITFNVKVGT